MSDEFGGVPPAEDEPVDLTESPSVVPFAARAGLAAIVEALEQAGARLDGVVIMLSALDVPEGETSAMTATKGIKSKRDLFEFLMGNTVAVGKDLGMQFPRADRPVIHKPGGGRFNGNG